MRICIRCKEPMLEGYDVKVEGAAYGLKITEPGIFKENLGKVRAAVCPACGTLEWYLEDTAKLNKG
ncbi:MAG: nucleic acid-binding protein [Gemmiger sp.]